MSKAGGGTGVVGVGWVGPSDPTLHPPQAAISVPRFQCIFDRQNQLGTLPLAEGGGCEALSSHEITGNHKETIRKKRILEINQDLYGNVWMCQKSLDLKAVTKRITEHHFKMIKKV